MTQPQTHFIDLMQTGSALTVQWRAAPGAHARPVDAQTLTLIGQQMAAVAEAERRAEVSRDAVAPKAIPPSGPGLEATQRALGETLYRLLDGADRALARRLDDARRDSAPLHLSIRLRTHDRKGLARHPGLGWPFQLLASPSEGPLALTTSPPVTITVQLGDAELTLPEKVEGGRLQVLFMAYSPRDVHPVLDFEAEEERILVELAPFVEKHRLVLRVAEEGSVAELRRRLMDRAYDIVHLTGHGIVTKDGARLVMEDADGRRNDVSAERLLQALRDGRRMPRMLVISSCRSAEQRNDLPSLAAELIEGGAPCVVGWTLPVLDTVATDAAEELYRRLCSGERPAEAVAKARRELHREDQKRRNPAHAWATLQMLATRTAGFAIDPDEKPAKDAAPPGGAYRLLGNRMRVLTEGFVGRRRELQMLGRILRRGRWAPPGGEERSVAGALVVGMKGQGKSCLVGRAIDRHHHDAGELSTVVLHGALDELALLEAFRIEAVRLGDDAAETTLNDAARGILQRIERLLRRHWRERRVVIVLDDFEQNLKIPGEGNAQLSPFAAALLEVLLPICRDEQPKLLITSTARFALPGPLEGLLAEIPLGALEASSIQKMWTRGYNAELVGLGPNAWRELGERFGRNARLLDWARQLLGGKTPDEVRRVMTEAGKTLPVWKDQPLDEAKQEELVAAFLRHMAFEEATRKAGPDAMTFIDRARVYEVPVPAEAFAELVDDLEISLERLVSALANLGLLEMGAEDGRAVYRVSPLVKAQFDAPDRERWHGVAAAYWWTAANRGGKKHMPWVLQSWEHALAAKQQDLADRAAPLLHNWLYQCGLYTYSASLGARHRAQLPESAAGLRWAGSALVASGELQQGRELIERSLEIAEKVHGTQDHPDVVASLHELARVLRAQGNLAGSRESLERSLEIQEKIYGALEHPNVAASFHALAGVLLAQGDLADARALLERSLEIQEKVHGTQDHPDVAASLHQLASVLLAQGDLAGARTRLERSLEIQEKVHGTQEPPFVTASLHVLAGVLLAQGDLAGARAHLERSLEIQEKVHGTQKHPNIAASLHELARVLLAQGDLAGGRARLERSLEIKEKVHGTQEHPDVAVSLHALAEVLLTQGDLTGARALLERSLKIQEKVHGTQEHPDVAASLHALAGVLLAQGDLTEAQLRLEISLKIQEKMHGTQEHPNVASSLHELARVLFAQGDLAGARARLERSLGIKERVYGTQQHPDVAASLHELARVLLAQSDLEGARACLERSLKIKENVHGTQEHPSVAASLHELARVLLAQSDLEGARARLERSLKIKENVHGTQEHPDIAASLHALAGVLHAQGDLAGARACLERSLEIKENVHGTQEHPDIAASLHALARVLLAQGDLAGAQTRLERSLKIKEKVHGTQGHPDIATIYDGLGRCRQALGLLGESERAFRAAMEIREKICGTRDHYQYAETEFALAQLLRQQERHDEARNLFLHVYGVLQSQVPDHPLLAHFRDEEQAQTAAE